MAEPYIKNYLAANPEFDVVGRRNVLQFTENLDAGAGSLAYLIESMHGPGPPRPSGS